VVTRQIFIHLPFWSGKASMFFRKKKLQLQW